MKLVLSMLTFIVFMTIFAALYLIAQINSYRSDRKRFWDLENSIQVDICNQ